MWGETKAARAMTGEPGKPLLAALWILCTLPWLGLAGILLESEADMAVVGTEWRAVQGLTVPPHPSVQTKSLEGYALQNILISSLYGSLLFTCPLINRLVPSSRQ